MIICFECSADTKASLDVLMATRHYRDYSELLSVAVSNLAVLQSHLQAKGVLFLDDDSAPPPKRLERLTDTEPASAIPPVKAKTARKRSQQSRLLDLEFPVTSTSEGIAQKGKKVPSIFTLTGLGDTPPRLGEVPGDVWISGQTVPLDRWLFGQYNRLLPAKASTRALLHLLKSSPVGVPLSEATQKIAGDAAALGQFLADLDAKHGNGRDDMLATAFPVSEDANEKGRLRFANQFVGVVNTHGRMSGLLIDLKLINYRKRKDKDPLVQLTQVGWEFARMSNPVFDGWQERPMQKFSEEEISLLLQHISTSVPAEDFAYRAILAAIAKGSNTPDALDAALQQYAPSNSTLTSSFLASQRSGAISRMSDLEIVARVREGVRVVYTVTPRGYEYVGVKSQEKD